ncbi:MAG: winged helix DNA-binding protein [Bacteroidota bacterium]
MKNKELLIELIQHLDAFESKQSGDHSITLNDFTGYLNALGGEGQAPMRRIEGDQETDSLKEKRTAPDNISILLVLMYRYVRIYIKKALKDSPVQTADEFSFLITLMTYESMTKTELITNQVMEKTSGTEIIKRLLKQGLIREFADPDDRRSVRVSITEKGRKELTATFPGMNLVAKIVIGNLSQPEIRTLYYLLKKLDFHHNDIFQNKRGRSLEELSSG